MIQPALQKNDKQARIFIITVSFVVFAAVVILSKFKLNLNLGFNVHVFALCSAAINFTVSVLLVAALIAVKNKKYARHKKLMMSAIVLSVLFLVFYIGHHLLAQETSYGGDGPMRVIYYFILATHIPLAGIILPFILFTAYRALTGDYLAHKKLAKYTFPLWLYVSVTGVLVYLLISPYYVPHL